ncbi:Uncharacterised protein [Vibrio cholerae]|nr:Uncharacterised protein [Vibrio cholerae]
MAFALLACGSEKGLQVAFVFFAMASGGKQATP